MSTITQAVKDGIITEREAKLATLIASGLSVNDALAIIDPAPNTTTVVAKPVKGTARPSKKKRSTIKKNAPWTSADEKRLLELWEQGYTGPQIARTLKRTPAGVAVRLSNLRSQNPKTISRRRPLRAV